MRILSDLNEILGGFSVLIHEQARKFHAFPFYLTDTTLTHNLAVETK